MFEPQMDAWYTWLGVAAASAAVLGVALALPGASPPSPAPVADAIDAVGRSDFRATGTVVLAAAEIRLGPHRVALRNRAGTATAALHTDRAVPVGRSRLRRLLAGARPGTVYQSVGALRDAIDRRRRADPRWRAAPDRLRIRRIEWRGVSATLVG